MRSAGRSYSTKRYHQGNAETAWDFPMLYLYSDMPEKPCRQASSSHSQRAGIEANSNHFKRNFREKSGNNGNQMGRGLFVGGGDAQLQPLGEAAQCDATGVRPPRPFAGGLAWRGAV